MAKKSSGGLKYVKDFEFPADQGFTGSAGRQSVKGYQRGGRVKNTSGEFKAKRGKQKTMDHGVQPARRGANARNQQEREAGGTGRMTPGLKKGGRVKRAAKAVAAGALAAATGSKAARLVREGALKPGKAFRKKGAGTGQPHGKRPRAPDKTKGKGMSKKGMPKNVKAKGGKVCYSQGGVVKKGEAAQ